MVWETIGFVIWKADPHCTYSAATQRLSSATIGLFRGWSSGKGKGISAPQKYLPVGGDKELGRRVQRMDEVKGGRAGKTLLGEAGGAHLAQEKVRKGG